LTRKAPARYHAPVPVTVLRLSLHELVDILEQIFTIAATCDLRDVTSEDREAAIHAYQAAHGLSATRLRDVPRSSLAAMREVDDLSRQAKLIRIYAKCWRLLVPEGGMRGHRKARRRGRCCIVAFAGGFQS
jgi:hypothetical protein